MNTRRTLIGAVLLALVAMLGLAACDQGGPATQDAQQQSQNVTEQYQQAAENAVPYPLDKMTQGGWLERHLLQENLLRQNDAHRVAYVTLLTSQGQPIIQYTIQGMVFSLNSQMTTTDKVNGYHCGANSCYGESVTKAPGDNGTYGPEPDGIGFFTTEGVEIKWNGLYLESDSPQDITTKPIIVYDASTAKPSVDAGGVKASDAGGIATGN